MLNVTLLSLHLPFSLFVTICISFTEAMSSYILPRRLHFPKNVFWPPREVAVGGTLLLLSSTGLSVPSAGLLSLVAHL